VTRRLSLLVLLLMAACSAGATQAGPSATPTPVVTTASPTPSPTPTPTVGPNGCRIRQPLPPGSVLSIIGDSYTTGDPVKGGAGAKGWPAIIGKRTGWTVYKNAQGASGYLSHGFTGKAFDGLIFLDQVKKLPAQHPDLVIVFGSDNDLRHTEPPWFVEYVRKTLQAVHKAAPQAYLVVATSFWYDDNPPAEMLYIGKVEKSETSRIKCAVFLDPIAEKWMGSAHRDVYYYPHNDHPTDAGHLHIADMWERDLRRLNLID
jgi:hypothetical protein